MSTYCEREGITPHRYKKDLLQPRWSPLLGTHFLCKDCGHTRIFIAHQKDQQVKR